LCACCPPAALRFSGRFFSGGPRFGKPLAFRLSRRPAVFVGGTWSFRWRGIVIDPFLGSGSTLIAADKTDRVCHGVELDPLYVELVLRRYEAATGNPAVSRRER
jgi:hypothetical protein